MTPRNPGPIAQKVLRSIEAVTKSKVVDLAAWRAGQERAAEILASAKSPAADGAMPPLFSAYSFVTNWALGHVESMQGLAELRRFTERIERAEEEYQPSAPPMSPITRSFFWHWALYDLTIGVKKETLGQVLLAVGRHLRMDPLFLGLLERLSESRMGLYVHEGTVDGHLRLRELATGAEHLSECTCTHHGTAGEVWLVRLAASPGPGPLWTMLTTPYVIAAPDITGWRSYFDRMLPKTSDPTRRAESYARFMKHGPEGEHWNEYVFEAYAGHDDGSVTLRGLPDVAESRPFSAISQVRRDCQATVVTTTAPARPVRKVSETLLDFAAPLIEMFDHTTTLAAVENVLQLATAVWNAVVFAEHGNSSYLADLRSRSSGGPPGYPALLKLLTGRKQTEFAADDWLVGEVRVAPPRGPQESFYVIVEARVPPTASSSPP